MIKLSDRKKRYLNYLNSKEWAEIRVEVLTKANFKCQRCGSKNYLQVHHLTYERIFKEEPEDLEVLCAGCHQSEHGIKKGNSNRKPKKPRNKKVNKANPKTTEKRKRNKDRKRSRRTPTKCIANSKKYSQPQRGSDVRQRIKEYKNSLL